METVHTALCLGFSFAPLPTLPLLPNSSPPGLSWAGLLGPEPRQGSPHWLPAVMQPCRSRCWATTDWPYLGCRWARCLSGGQTLLASSVALKKGQQRLSSPADCAVAPGVESWYPLPLLLAFLPLWGHKPAQT